MDTFSSTTLRKNAIKFIEFLPKACILWIQKIFHEKLINIQPTV